MMTYQNLITYHHKYKWIARIDDNKLPLNKTKTWVIVAESETKHKRLFTKRWGFTQKKKKKIARLFLQ